MHMRPLTPGLRCESLKRVNYGVMAMRLVLMTAMILGLGLGGYAISAKAATQAAHGATSVRAQAGEAKPVRPRPRIVVTPRQVNGSPYPSPYPYAWPGPGAVRDCVAW